MATSKVFGLALRSVWNKEIDFDTDALKWLLATSSYVPNLDTHQYRSVVTRSVTDGATTASSTTVTSATAAFTSADVGARISGGSIPAGATISSVTNGTTVVISAAATATATAVTLTVTHEVSGTGYTLGGVAATGASITYTAANSWATARANSTAYALGDVVRPATANGFLYRASVAGTSAATVPTYPTVVGQTVTDGGVTWTNIGSGVLVLDTADPAWTSATFSGVRYMVLYDSTPATDATRPLIALVDFVTDQSVTSGTFTGVLAATGIALFANG